MFNEEIYQKLLKEFGENKMASITDVISVLYDIKYNACKNTDGFTEYDYEREWWAHKHRELLKIKEVNL